MKRAWHSQQLRLALVAVLVLALAGIGATRRQNDATLPLGAESFEPLHGIEMATPEIAELNDNADLVVDAVVQSIQDLPLAQEPHLVAMRNAEQNSILAANPQVRTWGTTVTTWRKGSSPAILHLVRMRSGPFGGNDLLTNLDLVQVGSVYRFYLSRDTGRFADERGVGVPGA